MPDHDALFKQGFVVLDFRYRVVQLNRLDWRAFLRHPNPLAAGLMARMRVAKKDRARVKLECLRQLASLDLNMSRRYMLGYFVDTYLPLERAEQQQVEQGLESLLPAERITAMEMITSWEREGMKQGQHEAALAITTRLLTRKFGPLAINVQKRLAKLTTNDLADLSEALLDFTSMSDLRGWLDTHPASSATST